MNRQIEERKEIIHDFFMKIGYNQYASKSFKWLFGANVFTYLTFSILLLFVIFVSFSNVIHWTPVYEKWSKAGLLVSLTFMSIFNTRLPIIGYSLFKHFKKIKENKLEFDSDLNVELKKKLNRISERQFKPYYIGIPVIAIVVAGLIQQMSIYLFSSPEFINSVWDLFQFPVFLFSICLFWYINQQIWWIRKNIKAVELSGKK